MKVRVGQVWQFCDPDGKQWIEVLVIQSKGDKVRGLYLGDPWPIYPDLKPTIPRSHMINGVYSFKLILDKEPEPPRPGEQTVVHCPECGSLFSPMEHYLCEGCVAQWLESDSDKVVVGGSNPPASI